MGTIRRCPDHGPFEGEACPVCSETGDPVLEGDRRKRLSKFMSGALRHFPEDAGLSLDERGWTGYGDLVETVTERYGWADSEHVKGVIVTDPKGRFERTDERVRAAYGHSVDVELEAVDTPVPDELYHGTDPGNLGPIREEGLRPMGRQQVHLSETIDEALDVGRRHGADPAVLVVDAAGMTAGEHRIVRRGDGIYTTDRVAPEYLSVLD